VDRFKIQAVIGTALTLAVMIGCGSSGTSPGRAATLVFGRGGDANGLDPALEDDGESMKVCDNIYDTLVAWSDSTTDIVPALAKSWRASEDGTVWTFRLRSGVKFHDGTRLDADAVVFTFARQYDANHPAHDIEGHFKYWTSLAMDDLVDSVAAIDDSTVIFHLSKPYAPFLGTLAMNFCAIASPTAVTKWGDDFFKHPVGTGPFMFSKWVKDQFVALECNDDYWGEPPTVERLVFRSIPDNTARLIAFTSGAIDGMDNPIPDHIAQVKGNPKYRVLTQPGMNVGYLAMNTRKSPFDDPRVRVAVNHAVDKASLVATLYNGLAIEAKNPLPPTLWGYADDVTPYLFDPNRAKKLLAEAGYSAGFDTELWTPPVPRPYMPQPHKVAVAIQANLADVGIRARIVSMDWGVFLDKTQKGEHPMSLLGWIGDNGDPDNFVTVLLSHGDKTPSQNIAFYVNKEVDQLLADAARIVDQKSRAELYRRAQQIIHSDAPWVPLVHTEQVVLFRRGVEGFHLHPTGRKRFESVRITESPS